MEQKLPRLVRKSQKGDREAFTQLLLECEQMLSRVAMAILQDPEDAADAVQDAVLAAWESLGQLRQPRYFKTWFERHQVIAFGARIGALRNKHSHTQLEDALRGEESPDWDRMLDVNAALGSLAEQDRMLLGLFYCDGLSVREIAQALEVSEACVRQRLHRGRKRFQTAYLEKEELCHEK